MTLSKHVHPAALPWLAGAVVVSTALLIPAYAGNKTSSVGAGLPSASQREERVSYAEARSDAALKEWLAAQDTNCDGVLDEAELAAADNSPAAHETEVKR